MGQKKYRQKEYRHSTNGRTIFLDKETEGHLTVCNDACHQSIIDKLIEGYVLDFDSDKKVTK